MIDEMRRIDAAGPGAATGRAPHRRAARTRRRDRRARARVAARRRTWPTGSTRRRVYTDLLDARPDRERGQRLDDPARPAADGHATTRLDEAVALIGDVLARRRRVAGRSGRLVTRSLLDITDSRRRRGRGDPRLAEAPIDSLGRPLDGLGASLIFEKPSNRTRHSMEMAVVQLGGHPIYTRGEEVGFDTREPVEDVARIMAGLSRRDRRPGVRSHRRSSGWRRRRRRADRQHALRPVASAAGPRRRADDAAAARRPGRARPSPTSATTTTSPGRWRRSRCMLGMHVRLACPIGFDADDGELERLALLGTSATVDTVAPPDRRRRRTRTPSTPTRGCRWARRRRRQARRQAVRGLHGRRDDDGGRRPTSRSSCTVCRPTAGSR